MDLTKIMEEWTAAKVEKILKDNIALYEHLLRVREILLASEPCDECLDPTCQGVRNAIEYIEKELA